MKRPSARNIQDLWRTIVSPRSRQSPTVDTEALASIAPVVWLLGKVQSGKSSIVQGLTGATSAEIGNGLKPCTKTAVVYDFPEDAPSIRFLDTRGMGEAGYDPAEDLAFAERHAHLVMLVMKAMDPAQEMVLDVAREVRTRHPDWPMIVVQTTLHDAYDHGTGHPDPYPFDVDVQNGTDLPDDLVRMLDWQRQQIATLPGHGPITYVPVDFTQPDDGFEPRLYGLAALRRAIIEQAPSRIAAALGIDSRTDDGDLTQRTHAHIMGYATATAAAAVLPIAGTIAVPGIQGKMLHSLGAIEGVEWNKRTMYEFAGALGTSLILRTASTFGLRELAKLVPVYGQTVGAAAAAAVSFATTYALGKAAVFYLERYRRGEPIGDDVRKTYTDALRSAFDMAKEHDIGTDPKATGQ